MRQTANRTRSSLQTLAAAAAAIVAAIVAATLTGCSMGSAISVPTAITGPALHGVAFGGQQPVIGGTIQLYAAGSGGYGAAATPLIASTIKTDASGLFSITSAYTCPSASTQVYIVGTQGNSGFANNPNLAMMAALGSCGNLSSSTFITINEVTTVASVWALSPFMTGLANVATSSTGATGLANAFADVNLLANIATGAAPGTLPTGASAPTAEINTLANILAACVNSAGGTASDGSACGTLFAAANTSGTAPTDTIAAALNMAQHPGLASVRSLWTLPPPSSPFQPSLNSAPNDFTIAVNFAPGTLSAPSAIAADSAGNVYVTNKTSNTVTEFSSTGTVLSGTGFTGSLNAPSALAVDASANVWVANSGNNTVSKLVISGSSASSTVYSGGGLSAPSSIAFDALGAAWLTNRGNSSVTSISSNGSTLTNYTPAGVATPVAIVANPH
jgi:hypothetical protein